MLRDFFARNVQTTHGRLLWAAAGMLVLGQLLALGLLCNRQIRKAEVREAVWQVQRNAVADCLRYFPRATHSSCTARVDLGGVDAVGRYARGQSSRSYPGAAEL
jgi:hypothetical protein